MKKTIAYLFITALIPFSCAQQYANVGQQFANGQANGGQQFAQNQYQFWRPQFDQGGQYQSQPRFHPPQPQQQQYQQPQQQYQPQQFQAPPQQQFQAPPQQQFQPQQYQAQPQQVYQPQIQQQVQQQVQQVQQVQQQFQPQFQQQAYQQQPPPPPPPQQQQYQPPQQQQQQQQQQQFAPPQPRQPVYQQPQFNQAPPQQQVYQPQPQQQVFQQQAPPPAPVNQAPPQQQYQQTYPQHVYREQPQMFQQQQKQPYPQQQFIQQQVNRPPPQIYQHEFTVSQPAPPPPAPIVYQPAPPPATPAPPPPPERFFPHISDLYTGPTGSSPNGYHIDAPVTIIETEKNDVPYVAEEIIVDGHHPSYIENTERMQPPPPTVVHNRPQPRFVPQESILQSPDLPVASFDRPKQINRPQPAQVAPVRPPQPPPVQQSRLQPKPVVTQSRQPETVAATATSQRAPSPIGSKARASEVFLGCCQKRKVVKACERICSFDVLNKKTLTGMFLGTDPCPQSHGIDLLQCAAQNEDHTECCKDMGVHTTSAGNKCLGFCNMKPGVTFQADVSMLPCWGVLNDIKTCFKQYIEDHKL